MISQPRNYTFAGLALGCALLLFIAAPRTAESQSGRQKGPSPSPTPKSNGRSQSTKTSPAQRPSLPNETSADDGEDVVRVTSHLVPVPTTVLNARGVAITNLRLEDFELNIDGQPKPISDLTRADTPVRMAMLFDNSGSLSESRDFEKRAAERFFSNVMRPGDQAAIYSVATSIELAQPMTGDVAQLQRTIESFARPEGATSLYDAIFDALKYLKPYPGRRVIVIVSDGRDTTSNYEHDFESTLQRLMSDECQVYAVQTGIYDNANVRDLAAERRMQEFAAQTGGSAYTPRTLQDLDDAFAQISADLAQQYILSYYPGEDKRDGKYHLIAVRVKGQPAARIRARKGFMVKTRARV